MEYGIVGYEACRESLITPHSTISIALLSSFYLSNLVLIRCGAVHVPGEAKIQIKRIGAVRCPPSHIGVAAFTSRYFQISEYEDPQGRR